MGNIIHISRSKRPGKVLTPVFLSVSNFVKNEVIPLRPIFLACLNAISAWISDCFDMITNPCHYGSLANCKSRCVMKFLIKRKYTLSLNGQLNSNSNWRSQLDLIQPGHSVSISSQDYVQSEAILCTWAGYSWVGILFRQTLEGNIDF